MKITIVIHPQMRYILFGVLAGTFLWNHCNRKTKQKEVKDYA
jgi:hypothetical protein